MSRYGGLFVEDRGEALRRRCGIGRAGIRHDGVADIRRSTGRGAAREGPVIAEEAVDATAAPHRHRDAASDIDDIQPVGTGGLGGAGGDLRLHDRLNLRVAQGRRGERVGDNPRVGGAAKRRRRCDVAGIVVARSVKHIHVGTVDDVRQESVKLSLLARERGVRGPVRRGGSRTRTDVDALHGDVREHTAAVVGDREGETLLEALDDTTEGSRLDTGKPAMGTATSGHDCSFAPRAAPGSAIDERSLESIRTRSWSVQTDVLFFRPAGWADGQR